MNMKVTILSCAAAVLLTTGCATRALWGGNDPYVVTAGSGGKGTALKVEAVVQDGEGRALATLVYGDGRRYRALVTPQAEGEATATLTGPLGEDHRAEADSGAGLEAQAQELYPEAEWAEAWSSLEGEPFGEEAYRVEWGVLMRRTEVGSYEAMAALPRDRSQGPAAPPSAPSKGTQALRLVATPFTLAFDALGLPFVVLRAILG